MSSEEAPAVVNQDDQIIAQKEAIDEEIKKSSKLVGDLEELTGVEDEFKNDPVFLEKVKNLGGSYGHIRRIRPDGNCFYRAVAFSYFQRMSEKPELLAKFKSAVKPSKETMVGLGFPAFTTEDFYDNFMDQVEAIGTENAADPVVLFNDQGLSDYLVVFLRLLTSMHLKKEAEFYQNFMEGGVSVNEYCAKEVELMYRESDHIHVTALCKETGIRVRILYLDRGCNKEASPHDFPDEGIESDIHLLYRPGHYDILYPKQ